MAYISKKGQNSLVSKDNSISIKPSGGLYDGVDLSIKPYLEKTFKLECKTTFKEKLTTWKEKVKLELQELTLEELKKDKYRGPKGEKEYKHPFNRPTHSVWRGSICFSGFICWWYKNMAEY